MAVITVAVLRTLFRGLQHFRSAYEAHGIEVIYTRETGEWSLWDLEYLFKKSQERLPRGQAQAIDLCFVQNLMEPDAAEIMGIGLSTPVSKYANKGLESLIVMIRSGALPGYRVGLVA